MGNEIKQSSMMKKSKFRGKNSFKTQNLYLLFGRFPFVFYIYKYKVGIWRLEASKNPLYPRAGSYVFIVIKSNFCVYFKT